MRECPRCGAQVRCHRFEELEGEIPAQMKEVHKLFNDGELKEAKRLANSVSLKNRQLGLPGIDEELRVLFKKIKERRSKTQNLLYAT